MARARSKAWISATQQIPSTVHHLRGCARCRRRSPAGFVACSPEADFPGAGGMPITRDGVVVAGFSASGATIGPFVDIGVDRRYLIAAGQARQRRGPDRAVGARPRLRGPARRRRAALARRLRRAAGRGRARLRRPAAAGASPSTSGRWRSPTARWRRPSGAACGSRSRSSTGAATRSSRTAWTAPPTAGPFVAEAVAAAAATFQVPSERGARRRRATCSPTGSRAVPGGRAARATAGSGSAARPRSSATRSRGGRSREGLHRRLRRDRQPVRRAAAADAEVWATTSRRTSRRSTRRAARRRSRVVAIAGAHRRARDPAVRRSGSSPPRRRTPRPRSAPPRTSSPTSRLQRAERDRQRGGARAPRAARDPRRDDGRRARRRARRGRARRATGRRGSARSSRSPRARRGDRGARRARSAPSRCDDARGAQWTKLLFNAATNPLAALTGLTHGELCDVAGAARHGHRAGRRGPRGRRRARHHARRRPRRADHAAPRARTTSTSRACSRTPSRTGRPRSTRSTAGSSRAGAPAGVPTPLHAAIAALIAGMEAGICRSPRSLTARATSRRTCSCSGPGWPDGSLDADGLLHVQLRRLLLPRRRARTSWSTPGFGGGDRSAEHLPVAPEDVDVVIFTHLHWDHVGWSALFTDAEHHCHALDWDYWVTHGTRPGDRRPAARTSARSRRPSGSRARRRHRSTRASAPRSSPA